MDMIDARGIGIIRRFEGLRLKAYRDPAGILTIGWGHTGPDVTDGLVVTRRRADILLARDVAATAAGVDRLVTVPLAAHERAALVSFAYNVGLGALAGSTLLRRLNAGDRPGAAEEFHRWVHATRAGRKIRLAGLVRRREAEARLFRGDGAGPEDLTPPPGSVPAAGDRAVPPDSARCSSAVP
jgi:lysozyme